MGKVKELLIGTSMKHWNGHQMCAIDTETTGFDCTFHEMCQFSCIPLDANLKVRKDVIPFTIHLRLEHPERADAEAMKVNKLTVAWLQINGFDRFKAIDMFEEWKTKLKLQYTVGGKQKQIIPLGQNYHFDAGFIAAWCGDLQYREWFHYHYRDTMLAATYLNDRAGMHGEKVPFNKVRLQTLANNLNVEHEALHDSLEDAKVTLEVYRKLCMSGLLG